MDEKTIKETLLKGERVTLECKKAQSNVPVDAWKTYSAFANTYGGLILLGVHEDLKQKDISKRFTITGVDDADKIRKDFWNIVNNPEKVNVNLLRDEDVVKDVVKGGVKGGVKELTEIQEVIVKEMLFDPYITTSELAQKTGIKFRTLQRYVSQLQVAGIIIRESGRKEGKWVIINKE